MRRVTSFRILKGFCLDLTFDDGKRGTVDLSDLVGNGVFALWMDRSAFENIRIGSSGELAWGETIDLCTNSLYLRATGKSPQDLFPSLRDERVNA
jgi:hypothetical protein